MRYAIWILRASMACVLVAGEVLSARADEMRPALDAKLLMARYATGGIGILAAPEAALTGAILKNVPEIAVYSDGTVLTSDGGGTSLPLRMHVAAIPADILQLRFQKFYEGLADADAEYRYNCWRTLSDGTRKPDSCVFDAGTAHILLKTPGDGDYKSIAVYAGDIWRDLPDMRDFVPPAYFDLMAWTNGLRDLPSKSWQAPSGVVPGFSPEDSVCEVAEYLCR